MRFKVLGATNLQCGVYKLNEYNTFVTGISATVDPNNSYLLITPMVKGTVVELVAKRGMFRATLIYPSVDSVQLGDIAHTVLPDKRVVVYVSSTFDASFDVNLKVRLPVKSTLMMDGVSYTQQSMTKGAVNFLIKMEMRFKDLIQSSIQIYGNPDTSNNEQIDISRATVNVNNIMQYFQLKINCVHSNLQQYLNPVWNKVFSSTRIPESHRTTSHISLVDFVRLERFLLESGKVMARKSLIVVYKTIAVIAIEKVLTDAMRYAESMRVVRHTPQLRPYQGKVSIMMVAKMIVKAANVEDELFKIVVNPTNVHDMSTAIQMLILRSFELFGNKYERIKAVLHLIEEVFKPDTSTEPIPVKTDDIRVAKHALGVLLALSLAMRQEIANCTTCTTRSDHVDNMIRVVKRVHEVTKRITPE
jgi:hypothetical protein